MKTSAPVQLALFTASAIAAGSSTCAIDCFQSLITNGPPMQCKEATDYLCFCTMSTLQDGFVQCVNKDCGDKKDTAIGWANDLCNKLGHPISLGTPEGPPKTDETTDANAPPTSTSDEVKETSATEKTTAEAVQTTTTDAEPTGSKTQQSAGSETSEQTSETTAVEFTSSAANSTTSATKSTASKPKDTAESQASDDADETNAGQPTGDSAVTLTGSATPSSTSDTEDSNAGNFVVAPDFLVAAGIAAALWQLL
ncbi:hypothetical protein NW762_006587 [Fusarium torreyae]|uniref:CFEM domain-containing protein n=1 Tax=Fusarium torreyae TaxID=1237075 RepID=A0A9W8S0D0_9HYPO|nr:hypothetical protein NW762_006587 [Fusarium torreyae]